MGAAEYTVSQTALGGGGESIITGRRKEVKPVFSVTEITVENFKSVKQSRIRLPKGLLVLAGANNAGKTNLLEALAFLARALVREAERAPYAPHYPPYSSGLELLWARDSGLELAYTLKILYECPLYSRGGRVFSGEALFSVHFAYEHSLRTLVPIRLSLVFKDGYELQVSSDGMTVTTPFTPQSKHKRTYRINMPLGFRGILLSMRGLPLSDKPQVQVSNGNASISYSLYANITSALALLGDMQEGLEAPGEGHPQAGVDEKTSFKVYMFKKIDKPIAQRRRKLENCLGYVNPFNVGNFVLEWLSRVYFIRYIDRAKLANPHPPSDNTYLHEDASNLPEVIERYRSRTGRLPPTMEYLIREEFPGYRVWTSLSENWMISLNAEDNGVRIPAVSMPSGLIKAMAISVAVDLKPSLLLIDEVENSLHPRLIRRVLDILAKGDFTSIVATHSPTVIDMVSPENLVIVVRERGETRLKNVGERKKLLEMLEKEGLSVGEYVSYVETWRQPGEGMQ